MKEKGLTLIEVLVAMGIAATAGALLLVIIVNSAGLFTEQSSKVQEGLNSNDTLSALRRDIKQASAVAPSYTDGLTTYSSNASQLVLKVSSIDDAGNIIDNIFDYFILYLDQKAVHLKIFPDAVSSRKALDRVFATNVDNLKFQYLDSANPPVEVISASAAKVRVTLTLNTKIGTGFTTSTATTEANLRND
ncbi:MAG: prepilin-type N-terminal cleavage/methylation domain-containing protein [Candidatus Daviesbacteria bacterium]|nr:prepilin-type N-terminal cleavage/methylation domain-containing protein [Candidatus Daviesbacteria bacterium]